MMSLCPVNRRASELDLIDVAVVDGHSAEFSVLRFASAVSDGRRLVRGFQEAARNENKPW